MRRRRWLHWGCVQCAGLAALGPGAAFAQGSGASGVESPSPSSGWTMPPRFTRPSVNSDEGGLWAMMDREETRLRRSPFTMHDEMLTDYLTGIACRLGAEHCPDIRVYPIRTPYFNANMAPNGMMQIWSGLLLRVENEAQLAAVVAHEIGHYLQRHTLERLRDAKSKSAAATFMAMFGVAGLVGQFAMIASTLSFSRDQERDADRISIVLMQGVGYDPREASKVWANLLAELTATGKDAKQDSVLFATHPPSEERRTTLEAMTAGSSGEIRETSYREKLAPWRYGLLEDEIKRGRPDESIVLLTRLLQPQPADADLLYFRAAARRLRGKDGDQADAMADLEAAWHTGSEPAAAHRAMAEIHKAQGQPEAARAAWQRYLDKAPSAPDAPMVRQTLEEMK
jgi:predicted Zn-dependent protease